RRRRRRAADGEGLRGPERQRRVRETEAGGNRGRGPFGEDAGGFTGPVGGALTLSAWLDAVEPIALGRGGMTAAEFDAATPAEVQHRLDGVLEADDQAWQRTAQLA